MRTREAHHTLVARAAARRAGRIDLPIAQLADPEVLERMQVLGFEAAPGTAEQVAELIRVETKKHGDIVRRVGAGAVCAPTQIRA